ncbi:hypothetical protein QAD02_016289 [Eretmocerus hayati]|uniref:Uncharacterized protein n=1 Tax=Eretmocerus hayati TaxID=131215 RepID=A0ACC2PDI3_9HYME|nr:hypothetical protein QAD02_016289 [Eretmocerus hayati]
MFSVTLRKQPVSDNKTSSVESIICRYMCLPHNPVLHLWIVLNSFSLKVMEFRRQPMCMWVSLGSVAQALKYSSLKVTGSGLNEMKRTNANKTFLYYTRRLY